LGYLLSNILIHLFQDNEGDENDPITKDSVKGARSRGVPCLTFSNGNAWKKCNNGSPPLSARGYAIRFLEGMGQLKHRTTRKVEKDDNNL
jgi:hypothetical protein